MEHSTELSGLSGEIAWRAVRHNCPLDSHWSRRLIDENRNSVRLALWIILFIRITSDAGAVGSRAARQRKSGENIFRAKIQRNPLISIDSDERIQGNPRQSNR